MRRGHREAGHLCVCQGLEGVVMELMLWVEGLLGLRSVPPSSLQLWEGLAHLLGHWTLAFEHPTLLLSHKKVFRPPSGPALPPQSHPVWAPAPPASNSPNCCSHKPAPAHTPALQLPKAQASPPIAREVSRGAFAPTLG